MTQITRHDTPSGYNAFRDISRGTMAAVRHDFAEGSRYAAVDVIADLTQVSADMALDVLVRAREAGEADLDPEIAYLKGALSVVAAVVKQERALKLAERFGDIGNTGDLPEMRTEARTHSGQETVLDVTLE
jgi:hypothetical protein